MEEIFWTIILARIVLIGGGMSYFTGITELANEIFKLHTRVGSQIFILFICSIKREFDYYVEYNKYE